MAKLCKFTVLRYVPDEQRQEFINLGVVLHSPEDKIIDCLFINNFNRVNKFDDEVDITFLKIVLEGVKDDFSKSAIPFGPSFDELADINFLEKATSTYVNQLQFSEIRLIRSHDFETDLENLFKLYVHFEVQRKSRLTEQDVKSILNRVMKDNLGSHNEYINRSIKVNVGAEQLELDYAYKTKNERLKVIKTFSFDYTDKGSRQAPQLAKEWAYNFNKIRSKSVIEKTFNSNVVDMTTFIFIKNVNKQVSVAIDILKEETQVIEANSEMEIKSFANRIMDELKVENE